MKNKESIFSIAIFSVINLLYLFYNFTNFGCISIAFIILYYFLRTYKIAYSVSSCAGIYLGGLVFNVFLIKLFVVMKSFSYNIKINNIDNLIWASLILLIGFYIIFYMMKKSTDSIISMFLRYLILFSCTICSSFLFIDWNKLVMISIAITLLIITFLIELALKEKNESISKAIFSWITLLFFSFVVINCIYGKASILLIDYMVNDALKFPWYMVVLILVCLLLGVIETVIIRKNEINYCEPKDTQFYLSAISIVLYSCVMVKFKTTYNYIFWLVFVLINIIFIFNEFITDKVFKNSSVSITNCLYVVFMVATMFLPISFFYGFIVQYSILYLILITIYIFIFKELKSVKSVSRIEFYKTWFFWQIIITLFSIFGVVNSIFKCRCLSNYCFIICIYLITTLTFYIISIQNKLQYKNNYITRIVISIPVIFIMIFSGNQSNIKVNLNTDNFISKTQNIKANKVNETNDIFIGIDNKSKNIDIVKAYYFWMDNKDNIYSLYVNDNISKTIHNRNQELCIIVKDSNGVIYEKHRWFYTSDLEKEIDVGTLRTINSNSSIFSLK